MEELRKEANRQLKDAKCTIDKKKISDIENIKQVVYVTILQNFKGGCCIF